VLGEGQFGKYPEPGAKVGYLDDGTMVPAQLWQAAGGHKALFLDQQKQRQAGQQQEVQHGPLTQALAGSMPQSPGTNRYLPGMPSEAERNHNVHERAALGGAQRDQRMHGTPISMGMQSRGIEVSPLLSALEMGGPQLAYGMLQNQGLNQRAQMEAANRLATQQLHNQGAMDVAKIQAGPKDRTQQLDDIINDPVKAAAAGMNVDAIADAQAVAAIPPEVQSQLARYYDGGAGKGSGQPFPFNYVMNRGDDVFLAAADEMLMGEYGPDSIRAWLRHYKARRGV
jgi:hypothetical protein